MQQQDLGPLVDTMVLGTPSSDGGVEEYWFPRSAAATFDITGGPSLSAIALRPSDALRVTALELTPVIRRSRLIQRIDQIQQQRSSQLRQRLDQKAAREQELRESLQGNSLFQTVARNLNRIAPGNW
jgi:hypothetical protein